MTTTYPSQLVAGYATFDSSTKYAAMVNFKTSPTDSWKSNTMRNGSQHRKEQNRDQQHDQYQCRYRKRPEVRGGDQFQSSAATLCKDGTCSAEIRIKIASAIAAMARLSRSMTVNSRLSDSGKRIEAFET